VLAGALDEDEFGFHPSGSPAGPPGTRVRSTRNDLSSATRGGGVQGRVRSRRTRRLLAVLDGADTLRGFSNHDVRERLLQTPHLAPLQGDRKRESAKVGRILHRFHTHGLVAKIPRSRRWRTTRLGRRLMATAIQVREINFPQLLALAA
jgi:hypothetical protein